MTLKIALIILSSYCMLPAVLAQSSEKQRVLDALRSLSERYKSYKRISFTIAYKYAAEDKPGIYLDSLMGSLTMSGSRYHYSIDSTEFIGGGELSVTLFKEDKIMYLSRASAAMREANPVALLDSFLSKNDSVDYRLVESGGQQTITMNFKPGMTTKRIEYTIDRGSGLLTKMVNVVQSKELYAPSVRPMIKGSVSYAIVETDFRDYRQDSGEEVPNPGRYFKKQGKEYVTLPPYDKYKIFLGSPDL